MRNLAVVVALLASSNCRWDPPRDRHDGPGSSERAVALPAGPATTAASPMTTAASPVTTAASPVTTAAEVYRLAEEGRKTVSARLVPLGQTILASLPPPPPY